MILWAAGHRSWNHPHWTNHTRVIPWTSSVFFPLIWHSVKECISASNISESVCQEKETPKEKKKVVVSLTSVYPVWSHLSSFLLWHKYCLNDEDNVHAYEEQMYKRKEAPCACFSLGLGEITGTSRCYLWVSTWAHWGSILQGDRPFLSTVRAKKQENLKNQSIVKIPALTRLAKHSTAAKWCTNDMIVLRIWFKVKDKKMWHSCLIFCTTVRAPEACYSILEHLSHIYTSRYVFGFHIKATVVVVFGLITHR